MLNTQMLSKIAGVSLATSLAFIGTTHQALALNFSFSFNDTAGDNTGTVSGTAYGLNDNMDNQEPTSVTIDSAPSSLGVSLPITLTSADYKAASTGFDVSGGSITDANVFYVSSGEILRLNHNNLNTLTNRSNGLFSINNQGFSGATYSSPTAVPFGPSTDLGLGILGGIWGISRLRKAISVRKLIGNSQA